MKIEKFTLNLPKHYDDLLHPSSFTKPKFYFKTIKYLPWGYTTPYIGHLINYAVSLLERDECHLQIGPNCAKTLAYGMNNQLDKLHYLINDLTGNNVIKTNLNNCIKKNGFGPYLKQILGNPIDILQKKLPILKHKIGVCFYDQPNDRDAHLKTLDLLEPYLADSAIIIMDDINWYDQRYASYTWVKNTPNAEILFDLPTPINGYHTWWNGIHVIGYNRKHEKKSLSFHKIKKKSIILLSYSIEEGGSEEAIFTLAKSLDKSKYNISVACLYEGPMMEMFREHKIKCFVGNGKSKKDKFESVKDYVQKMNPDFLMCNYIPEGHFFVSPNTKTIEIVHAPYTWLVGDQKYIKSLQRSSKIICVSSFVLKFMNENFKNIQDKLMVIDSGSEERKIKATINKEEVRENLGIPENGIVLGSLSRIYPSKGIDRIIEAAKILNEKYPNLHFVIPGDYKRHKQYFNQLKKKIEEYGLQNIIFPGFVKNVANILQTYDIFLFPSHNIEGLQLSLVEALKIGLPVVTTNVGVVTFDEDIADGEAGFVINEYTDDLFCEKLSYLIENEKLRKSIGKRNKEVFAEKYTAFQTVQKYEDVLEKLGQ